MLMLKRIFLFIILNALVMLTITFVLDLLNVKPFLSSYGLDIQSLMVFCLLWGMGGAFISLGLSRMMAKWLMGVQIIDPRTQDSESKYLIDAVRELAHQSKLPMPQVGIYPSNEVNAFATGPSKNRSLVAVSSGLLQKMKHQEIRGVLAHEISHISNGDMVTMTLLQGVVNAFVMFLARILAYVISSGGRKRENGSGSLMSYMLFVYLFEILFMLLGSLVVAAYSRYREFRADAGGVSLTGKDTMIAALKSLESSYKTTSANQESHPSIAAFKISHSGKRRLLRFFSTHPPLEERIERIQNSI